MFELFSKSSTFHPPPVLESWKIYTHGSRRSRTELENHHHCIIVFSILCQLSPPGALGWVLLDAAAVACELINNVQVLPWFYTNSFNSIVEIILKRKYFFNFLDAKATQQNTNVCLSVQLSVSKKMIISLHFNITTTSKPSSLPSSCTILTTCFKIFIF